MTVPTIGIHVPVWGRPGVTRALYQHLLEISAELEGEIALKILAVTSTDDDLKLARDAGVLAMKVANSPLSSKCNLGMRFFEQTAMIGVISLGSDDFPDAAYFRWVAANFKDHAIIGVLDMYQVRVKNGHAIHWAGYPESWGRKGETVGAGRFLRADVLDAVNWEPWQPGMDNRLDSGMRDKLKAAVPELVATTLAMTMADAGVHLVCPKTEDTITNWFDLLYTPGTKTVGSPVAFGGAQWPLVAAAETPLGPRKFTENPSPHTSLAIVAKATGGVEVDQLLYAIQSAQDIVDEVVLVLDSKSCLEAEFKPKSLFGTRVFRRPWTDDFAAARNFAQEKCRGKWIVVIDRDEEFTQTEPLKEALATAEAKGFDCIMVETHCHMGSPVPEIMLQPRAYLKDKAHWIYPVHNQLIGQKNALAVQTIIKTSYHGDVDEKAARSLPMLEKFVKEQPDDVHGWHYLARTHMALGNMAEAEGYCWRTVNLAPAEPAFAITWVWLARCVQQLRGQEAYEAVVSRALVHHPGFHEVLHLKMSSVCVGWANAVARMPPQYLRCPRLTAHHQPKFRQAAALLGLPVIPDA